MLELICENCGEKFLRQPSNARQTKRNFCSQKCFSNSKKGINPFPDRKYEKKEMHLVSCTYCNQPIYRWRYQLQKTQMSFCNQNCQGKWNSIHMVANKSHNWKGGEYTKIAKMLSNNKWRLVRKHIIKLDNEKCVFCNSTERLEIHHIIEKGKNLSLVYDVSNLVTLCKNCHCNIRGNEESYVGIFNDIVENRVNCGKPRTGNPQPSSLQCEKVQRLPEDSTLSLMTGKSARHESDEIVQVR